MLAGGSSVDLPGLPVCEHTQRIEGNRNTSAPPSSAVLLGKQAGVVRLTLRRRERRNARSLNVLQELKTAIERIATDSEARVVVIAGAGTAFCAGHDLSEMEGRNEAEYRELFSVCSEVMLGLRNL